MIAKITMERSRAPACELAFLPITRDGGDISQLSILAIPAILAILSVGYKQTPRDHFEFED